MAHEHLISRSKQLTRSLTRDDISRFVTIYGPRVRHLHLARAKEEKGSSAFFQALQELKPGTLTPNVTDFRWYTELLPDYHDIFHFAPLFLPRTAKRVTLHILPDDPFHQTRLPNLLDPKLIYLGLTWRANATSEGKETIGKKLSMNQFKDLCELGIPHISPEVMEEVSRLPNLDSLFLSDCEHVPPLVDGPLEFGRPRHRQAGDSFPKLEFLMIVTACGVDSIFGVLQYLTPATPLTSLSVVSTPLPLAHDPNPKPHTLRKWQTFIGLVQDYCNPDTLESLELKESDYEYPEQTWSLPLPTEPIKDDIETLDISPLFAFKNIATIRLGLAHGVWLTKDVVEAIPNAWPHAMIFDFNSFYPSYRKPRIDHQDVLNMVHGCSGLRSLGLHFDASKVPDSSVLTLPKAIKRLRALQVGNSPIANSRHVAGFLSTHFPRLSSVAATNGSGSLSAVEKKGYMNWGSVNEFVRAAILERRSRRNAGQ